MADSSPLAGLLQRAGNVFSFAGNLGRAFHEEHQGQQGKIDPDSWDRYAPGFNEYCAALLDLRDAMQHPPEAFAPVAKPLLEAASIAKSIQDAMQRPDGRTWAAFLEFFPHLNSVGEDGRRAVKELANSLRLDDPFACLDKRPADVKNAALSLLDQYPATRAGHVAFLEMVRDEIQYAADAKAQRLAMGYSNETLASMIRGIKWAEAGKRVSMLFALPAEAINQVARVLQRELTVGTVEQIDELITPAVRNLRDASECSKSPMWPTSSTRVDVSAANALHSPGDDSTGSKPKRRGRKKADFETVQREAKLAADWKRARDAGTYKGEFVKERGITLTELDKLLDRVAKRKSRSDK